MIAEPVSTRHLPPQERNFLRRRTVLWERFAPPVGVDDDRVPADELDYGPPARRNIVRDSEALPE